jgi:hypothetical protein
MFTQSVFVHKLLTINIINFENCALLGYYGASSGNPLPTFRDNLSLTPLRVKNRHFGQLLPLLAA